MEKNTGMGIIGGIIGYLAISLTAVQNTIVNIFGSVTALIMVVAVIIGGVIGLMMKKQ